VKAHRAIYDGDSTGARGGAVNLWQGRFASYVMDDRHTLADPHGYRSSTRFAPASSPGPKTILGAARALIFSAATTAWSASRRCLRGPETGRRFSAKAPIAEDSHSLRRHERTGRPLGSDAFVDDLERVLGRALKPRPPGTGAEKKRDCTP